MTVAGLIDTSIRGENPYLSKRMGTLTRRLVWSAVSFLEAADNAAAAITSDRESRWRPDPHEQREAHARIGLPDAYPAKVLDPNDGPAVEQAARVLSTAVRHGHSYFDASAQAPDSIKPTLLYYGCLTLAKAISAATFGATADRLRHGLRTDGRAVTVKAKGEFVRFHQAICLDPSFLRFEGSERSYSVDQLVLAHRDVREAARMVGGRWTGLLGQTRVSDTGLAISLEDLNGRAATTHLLATHLMTAFALSDRSRYDALGWEQTLGSGDGYVYSTALQSIALDFPLKCLNMITGVRRYEGRLSLQPVAPDEQEEGDVWLRP